MKAEFAHTALPMTQTLRIHVGKHSAIHTFPIEKDEQIENLPSAAREMRNHSRLPQKGTAVRQAAVVTLKRRTDFRRPILSLRNALKGQEGISMSPIIAMFMKILSEAKVE